MEIDNCCTEWTFLALFYYLSSQSFVWHHSSQNKGHQRFIVRWTFCLLSLISAVKLYDHESGRKAFHSARKSTFWWINVTLSPCVNSVNWVLHDFVSSIICKFLVHKSFNIAVSTRKLHTLIIMWSNLYLPFLYFLVRVIYRVLSLYVCKPWNVFRSTPLIKHEIFPLPKRSCNWSLTVSRLLSAT